MKTTSGSLSLLSATNRWCWRTQQEESMGREIQAPPHFLRQHDPNSSQLLRWQVLGTARISISLEPRNHPTRMPREESLTRDIQRPSPCTSCTGVGLLAGFSSPLMLASQLLQKNK